MLLAEIHAAALASGPFQSAKVLRRGRMNFIYYILQYATHPGRVQELHVIPYA